MRHENHNPRQDRYGGISSTAIDDNDQHKDGDYALVREAVEFLTNSWQSHPSLEQLAKHLGMEATATQKLFTRWAGISPKEFCQAITLDHAKRLLRKEGLPILDASFELGLSSPSRLHDLFVTHEAMPPGIWKAKGLGLNLKYGFHTSPFGQALLIVNGEGHEASIVGLGFCDSGEENLALDDMMGRWPNANYHEDLATTGAIIAKIFNQNAWQPDTPLRVTLIGTDFQIRVWDTLLGIPMGAARTYSDIAEAIENPKAVRAVGAAVGKNPISFVVPCHRALGKSGNITGYHWGLTRKRAMLGWEAGVSSQA